VCYLVDVPPSIGRENVEAAGREKSSEQANEEDLQNRQPCYDEQRPEPHLGFGGQPQISPAKNIRSSLKFRIAVNEDTRTIRKKMATIRKET
jgi:hypothetical protein